MKSNDINLKGRWLKVVDDDCIRHYPCIKGEYMLFSHHSESGLQYWGDQQYKKKSNYFGFNCHVDSQFELMPEGWHPSIEENNYEIY